MSGQDEGQWSEDVWRIWERNRWKWQKKTLIPVINTSWLSLSDAGFFGCVICKMTKQNNEYANFEVVAHNFNNMKRHASSKQHLQALGQLQLIDVPADEDAPSVESFEAVARGRMKGPVALRHGETGVGGRKKITHMVQCLGAAIVELDRRFLASAATITLHTDVRKLKLLVRFRAANLTLDSKRGILGIKDLKSALAIISIFFSSKKHGVQNCCCFFSLPDMQCCLAGTTSSSLMAALTEILTEFCRGDQDFFRSIVKRIEVLDADGASDEQTSARDLRAMLLKDVKIILRDKAHASRRVLSRPWSVIPELSEAWNFFVDDSNSIVRMIENSAVLSVKFHEYCQAMESAPVCGKRIRSLSFAKQRFDSVAKPLGRGILFWEAVLQTAIWCTIHRRGKEECKTAEAFLDWISETKLILLGMCADCADAALGLVRSFDSEEHDPAVMHLQADRFLGELHYLFNQGCVFRAEGYCQHILTQLRTPRGYLLRGSTKSIGGPEKVTAYALSQCLASMRLYVSLAVEVVNTEFPSFELLNAFALFDVQQNQRAENLDEEIVRDHGARLCRVFQLNLESFLAQYLDHLPIAINEARARKQSNEAAWRSAVNKTSSRSSLSKVLRPETLPFFFDCLGHLLFGVLT